MKENLIEKFLKFSYGSWVGLLLGLFTTMIITRLISVEALGIASMYSLFIQLGMIIVICGADQAFGRFFYEEDEEKRGFLLFNSLKLPLINILIVTFLVLLFYRPITIFLFGSESFILAILISFGIIIQLFVRFSQLILRMQQKANLYSLTQIFQKVFLLVSTLLFVYLIGNNFRILIYSELVAFTLVSIVAIYFGRHFWSVSNLKTSNTKHSQKDIIKFGLPFVFTVLITWLFEGFDKIALRHWSTFEELGLYTAAMRLVALLLIFKSTFSTFWTPVSYEKFENNFENKDFFKYISIVVTFIMFFIAIVSIASKDWLVLLLGNEFKESAKIMPFLVFIPLLYTISETTVIGINFYKKINWHIFIALICCVLNIFGNWLLVPNYGAVGASISTAFTFVIFFTLRTLISLKYFKVRYPLIRIYILLSVISFYSVLSIISENFWINIFLGLGSTIILITLFYKDLIYILKNRTTLL